MLKSPPSHPRTCAGCDACCTVMAIRELEKPPGRRCSLLMSEARGCSVWGEHPASCQSYLCLWRRSEELLPPELFPPHSGLVLSLDQTETWPAAVTVSVDPARPDAWDTPANRSLFLRLAAAWNTPVVIMQGDAASHAFAPTGALHSRVEQPELFPHEGRGLNLPWAAYGEDRRPPRERIAEVRFSWRS